MGLLSFLLAVAIAATIVAVLFTMNSNYLDTNINPSLDLTRSLRLKGAFTEDDIRANNNILRDHLNAWTKLTIICDEMDKHNRKYQTIARNMAVEPQQSTPLMDTPSSQ